MSRVVPRQRRRLVLATAAALSLAMVLGVLPGVSAAQELPAVEQCSPDSRTYACSLPAWPDTPEGNLGSVFGQIDGTAWIEDEIGDVPESGLDILAVGVGRVTIDEPADLRGTPGLLKLGKFKRALPAGTSLLLRVVLDRAPEQTSGAHASVHLVTDVDGSRRNNVPSGVAAPDFPFAGSQDVYTLAWASTTGKTRLFSSNLAKGWYKARQPFAAAWAAPAVLDMLITPSAFGEGFRVVTHAAGGEGGYDTLSLGPAPVPADGRVGLVPACIEGSIVAEPFTVPRLFENDQVVRDVEARASWQGGAAIPVDGEAGQVLARLIAEADEDGSGREGRISIPAWVNLFEDGIVIRQRADLELALDGDGALIATELGLTRRGYNVLRDFEPEPTGERAFDEWLEGATDALRETMPPFRLNKRSGLLVGEAVGSCIPWFALADPTPVASAAPAVEPPVENA